MNRDGEKLEEIHGATQVSRTREALPHHSDDAGENSTVAGRRNSLGVIWIVWAT